MNDVLQRLFVALSDRYRIDRELGVGGMATVYLAHDLKHDRDVAVKVLHPELGAALGSDRFLSEIRTTARLQHPHILPVLDSGTADSLLYYVMPYVTGETLRARLTRERQLPIDDALRIAREVADALGYAHTVGIIHRDIKPENVLLQRGHALVTDFGIALAVQQAGGARMTQTGLSLGTPQYMSPEQAMGERSIDARSDIYALGAVTYEMLVGEPPFTGPTVQAIVARVMSEEPRSLTQQRKAIPFEVEQAVLRALEKLPADRFAATTDFVAALGHGVPSVRPSNGRTVRSTSRVPILALGAIALTMTVVAAWLLFRPSTARPSGNGRTYETAIVLPDSTPLAYIGAGPLGVGTPAFAVSPDGGTLVFVGQSAGTTRLYVRPLDASSVSPLPGTEGAYAPFFSPDGQSVGFFAGGSVKRTTISGGATVALADLVLPYGAAWLADGRILIMAEEGRSLVAVPSAGGAPNAIGPQPLPLRVVFLEPLPGDSAVLASTIDSHLAVVSISSGRTELLSPRGPIPLDSVTEKTELFSGTNPRYVTSGHLIYYSLDGAVMALPFDPTSRRALGAPVPTLSGVRLESIWGAGQLAVTRDGTLIYARGENGRLNTLVWRDEKGDVETLGAFGRADYGHMDLSADGTRLLVKVCTSQGTCAPHALSLREGVQVRLPADFPAAVANRRLGWWDGTHLVFDLRIRPATSASSQTTLIYSPESPARSDSLPGVMVHDVAPDGGVLYTRADSLYVALTAADVAAGVARRGFLVPEPDAWGHQLRKGGEWIAYTARSEQAGEYVVFIARTVPPYEHWRASPRGGEEPVWSPAGDLVYREGNRWMSVSLPNNPGARPGVARFLFTGQYLNVLGRSHDIAPDGRHLLIAGPTHVTTTMLTVVTNWVHRLPRPERKP